MFVWRGPRCIFFDAVLEIEVERSIPLNITRLLDIHDSRGCSGGVPLLQASTTGAIEADGLSRTRGNIQEAFRTNVDRAYFVQRSLRIPSTSGKGGGRNAKRRCKLTF
jgi:hypothetical protein